MQSFIRYGVALEDVVRVACESGNEVIVGDGPSVDALEVVEEVALGATFAVEVCLGALLARSLETDRIALREIAHAGGKHGVESVTSSTETASAVVVVL